MAPLEAPSAPLIAGKGPDGQGVGEGSPTWTDLSVPDLEAVRPYYESLFGWSFRDLGEDAGHYHLIERADGSVVGGARSTGDQPVRQLNGQYDEGRPTWTVFLAAGDVQETMTTVEGAAGTVLTAPTPIGELGLRAVAISPAGDRVGWWHAFDEQSGTTDLTHPEHGAPVWFELMSMNYDTHLDFYRDVSGWEPAPWQGEHLSARYTTNFPGERATAGMLEATNYLPTGTISYWRVYIGVDDLEAAVQKAQELGGTVLAEPVDSPHGRMAVVRDPQGAGLPLVQLPG